MVESALGATSRCVETENCKISELALDLSSLLQAMNIIVYVNCLATRIAQVYPRWYKPMAQSKNGVAISAPSRSLPLTEL